MSGEFTRYLNISEDTARLFAYSSLGTWFTDCLDIAPCLSIASPAATESLAALRLLNCFCRHSLIVGEISQSGLQSLPSDLQLSLLINEPSLSTKIQNLLNTSTCRGLSIPQNGKLIKLYGAKSIAGREHPSMLENVIRVAISPRHGAQLSLLNRQTLEDLAREYQAKLLMYRLKNLSLVLLARPDDVVGFTLPLLEVTRNVGLCFAERELRSELNDLLRDQDDEVRGDRLVEHPSVVLEALLVLCHEPNRQSVTVEEITELVNALLTGRGETVCLSYRGVGAQLKSLQIFTRRFSGGKNRGIHFDVPNRKKMHQLATDYDVPLPLVQEGAHCPQCVQGA